MSESIPTILITGGAQGIGRALCGFFISKGYSVVCADIDETAGAELLLQFKNEAQFLWAPCNVANENQVQHMIQNSIERFGGLTTLINCAAVNRQKPISELTLVEWSTVIASNLTGPFLCSKYAAPFLKQNGGSIINIASTRALMSEANTEAYSASKGGLISLTHSLAISLAPDIRVNCISPGWIDVSEFKKSGTETTHPINADDHALHPSGRVGTTQDICYLVDFLASNKAQFITGANYIIDGGMTRKMIY
ncbi:MAG: SDR family oxidoreductase [Gammaproteobacteria bacterium]|nr:SDR family oxidoreductase [Gammaproteobacteria bacterium]